MMWETRNEPKADTRPKMIRLMVGGKPFILDDNDMKQLDSEFLWKLVDEHSEFQKPEEGGFYEVEADPKSFSVLLHFVQYGDLPVYLEKEDNEQLLVEADFWGLKDRIQEGIVQGQKHRAESFLSSVDHLKWSIKNVGTKYSEEKERRCHHNVRRDVGSGRIHCAVCGHRDIDSRFREGDRYTTCKGCQKQIKYKANLEWCHKCEKCRRCQIYKGCPCTAYARYRKNEFPYCGKDYRTPAQCEKDAEKALEDTISMIQKSLP